MALEDAGQAAGEPPPAAPGTPDRPPDRPARRSLRIYAFDPMLANTLERSGPGIVTVDIPWEPLKSGPSGSRVQVVDLDGGRKPPVFYEPIDLDHPQIAAQSGLRPSEVDPRFHQQMTYVVAMRTLDAFDSALGRPIRPRGGVLKLFPHAFRGENAYYDPDLRAVLFGYFQADAEHPGLNLPSQNVYTCLSHDIIAHEVTHAMVHRMRPLLLHQTNRDVAAFHEAIADITAIFLHFTLPGVLESTIATTRTRLTSATPLVELAQQFGYATGGGGALRSALDRPDPKRYETVYEPHARGSILVAALFDAFLTLYQRRIADLLRLATGGTGVLPRGSIHPDLVTRVAREARRAAEQILTISLRAFDYLPPLDITFSDFLRAMVTADQDLFPSDAGEVRLSLVDAFRRRGIFPLDVQSLADDSLGWPSCDETIQLPFDLRAQMLALNSLSLDTWESLSDDVRLPNESVESRYQPAHQATDMPSYGDIASRLESMLIPYCPALDLSSETLRVTSFQTLFRYDEDGASQIRFAVQLVQQVGGEVPGFSEHIRDAVIRRATTVIFDERGVAVRVISKPFPGPAVRASAAKRGTRRRTDMADWLDTIESRDPGAAFGFSAQGKNPLRMNFASLHGRNA